MIKKYFIINICAAVLITGGILIWMFFPHWFMKKSNNPEYYGIQQITGEIVHIAEVDEGKILYIQKLYDRPAGKLYSYFVTEEMLPFVTEDLFYTGVIVHIRYTFQEVEGYPQIYPICEIQVKDEK